jgi:hypothetical protein
MTQTKLENEYEVKEMVTFPQTITCERILLLQWFIAKGFWEIPL